MALANYSDLKTSVSTWLDRTDLDTVLPDLITLAEASLNRTLRHRLMLQRSNASIDAEYTSLPSDFLEMKALQINGDPVRSLEYLTPQQMDVSDSSYRTNAKPLFFSVIKDYFQVLPVPDATYTGELIFYSRIPALSDSQTTNWLLDDHPDIYLYGTLRQASPYLREDERMAVWESLYAARYAEAQAESERTETYGSSLRIKHTPLGD